MTFLSSSVVVVVMFLLSIIKVYIPSIERRMTVKELLNVVKFLVQTIRVECFPFQNPKVFLFLQKQSQMFSSCKGFCNFFNCGVCTQLYIVYIVCKEFPAPPPFKAHTPVPACILFLNFSFPQPSVFQTVPPPSHRQPSYCPNPKHQHNSIPWT